VNSNQKNLTKHQTKNLAMIKQTTPYKQEDGESPHKAWQKTTNKNHQTHY
jgi:hypothetical protein